MNAAKVSLLTFALAASSPTFADDSKSEKFNDAWLDGKTETVLMLNPHLNNFEIDTVVSGGIVMLSGEVDSSIDKRLAEELALSVKGVTEVENKLTVKNKQGIDEKLKEGFVDSKIATVVKTKLLMESEVSGRNINVSSDSGAIILEGSVSNGEEKDLAAAIARNTADVREVVNKLSVKS